MQRRDTPWLIGLLLLIAAVAAYRTAPQPAPGPSFTLDIDSGAVANPAGLPVEVLEGPEDQRALLKVNMKDHRRLRVRLHFGQEIGGWSLNIGDSRTNNGYSGDSGTQTNDSELQILNSQLSLWASDRFGPKEGRRLELVEDFVRPGQTVELLISDQRVVWSSPQAQGELESPYLFALNGQMEQEGEINYDLFLGLGRVVAGTSRSGSGITSVEVECLP